jgi:hypothetical protein
MARLGGCPRTSRILRTEANEHVESLFPRLKEHEYRVTSPICRAYNCVAWVNEDKLHWWQPGGRGGFYWPAELDPDDDSLAAYEKAMRLLGYEDCDNGTFEDGVEKICVYADNGEFSHVAVQVSEAWWSSKLGGENDISHRRLESLLHGRPERYGETLSFMSRPRAGQLRPHTGLIRV